MCKRSAARRKDSSSATAMNDRKGRRPLVEDPWEVSLLQKLTPKRKQQRNRITPRMCELRIMEVDGITASVVAPGLTVTPPVRQTFSSEIFQKARMRLLSSGVEGWTA